MEESRLIIAHCLQSSDLVNLALDEGLAAKPGVDAHDENQVEDLDDLLDGGQRCPGVEHGARKAPEVLDLVEAAVQVDRRCDLRMHGDDVGTRLGKVRDTQLWLDDHLRHAHGVGCVHDGGRE